MKEYPYKAVTITANTPMGVYTTAEIPFDDNTAEFVHSLLTGLHNKMLLRFPLAGNELVLIPGALVQQSTFNIRYTVE